MQEPLDAEHVDDLPALGDGATPAPGPLTPEQELLLQQLLQLRFAQERRHAAESAAAPTSPAAPGESPPSALPERWELLRGLELHDWQRECVDAWFLAGRRGVLKVVTGAGKTILALAIAERLQQGTTRSLRVAIVVPTVVLLAQWLDELRSRSNLPASAIGAIGGGRSDKFDERVRVLVCVLSSASRKLAAEVARAGVGDDLLVIVDECHRAGAGEMRHVFETRRAFSLGLSATPERDEARGEDGEERASEGDDEPVHFDDSVLGQALGPVIFELSYADAIRREILPPFRIVHHGLSLGPKERASYGRISREIKDLRSELESGARRGLMLIRWCTSKAAAGNAKAQRLLALTAERKRLLYHIRERSVAVDRILRDLFDRVPDGKAILFHESIDEVMALFAMLQRAGLPVVAEHSQFPDALRAESLRLFRRGTARIIVSARSLIEGFNVPSADVGIIVAASASVRQRVQTLGRLLRKDRRADGTEKEATLYVLYAANTVDELIYQKADWEHFTGANINEYFVWKDVASAEPERRAEPPRAPSLGESAVDAASLKAGAQYPGDPDEGRLFTIDSQGTIRDDDGGLLKPNPALRALLQAYTRSAGRFRVTPKNRFILKLEKTPDGWKSVYLGRLDAMPELASPDEADAAARDYAPGDPFPLGRVKGRTFSVLQRDKRLVAEKVRDQVRFVVPAERLDGEPRALLRAIQQRLAAAYTRGHRMSKITVTGEGHVVYVFNNEAYFVGNAPEGEQGFRFEDTPHGR